MYVYTARQFVRKNNGSGSKCHVQWQPMILAGSTTRELVKYGVFWCFCMNKKSHHCSHVL